MEIYLMKPIFQSLSSLHFNLLFLYPFSEVTISLNGNSIKLLNYFVIVRLVMNCIFVVKKY